MAAAFDIYNFRAVINQNLGFMKPDRYRVRFPIPQAMAINFGANYDVARYLEFYADTCQLVGVGFSTVNIARYGYGASEKKPIFPNFNDILITFYSDTNGSNLGFFQDWMNIVENFDLQNGITSAVDDLAAYEFNYRDDYVVDGMITLMNTRGEELNTWHPRRMYPSHIPETQLGWSLTHDIMRISVMFSYSDWYRKPVDTNNNQTIGIPLTTAPP